MSTVNIQQQQEQLLPPLQQQQKMEEDQETTESPLSPSTTTTTTMRNDNTTANGNNKRTHNQIEVEDTEMSLDEDDESDEDDEQMDYFQRKRTFMVAGAASTAITGKQTRSPTSFNYTVLTPEKLQDHPIILRGCDVNTMWDMKELYQLRDNLRQLYDKSRKMIKIFKRDLKKIEMEMQSKQYLPKNKKRKMDNDNNSSNNPGKTSNVGEDDDNDDYLLHIQRMRVCGVMNSKGKLCQRTGFCPFHHRFMGTRRRNHLYSFLKPSKEISANDPAFDVNRSMLAANKKEKNTSMKVSILLVAAAALERNVINEESSNAQSNQQQIGQQEHTNSGSFLPSHYLQQYDQQYDQQQQQTAITTAASSSNYYDHHKFTPLWSDSTPGMNNFTQSPPAFLASLPTRGTEESYNLPRPAFQEYNNYNAAPLTSNTPPGISVGNASSLLPFPNTLHPIDTTANSGDGRSVPGLPSLGVFVQQPAPTHSFPSGSIPPLKELGATPFYQTFPLSSTMIPPSQQQPHQEKYLNDPSNSNSAKQQKVSANSNIEKRSAIEEEHLRISPNLDQSAGSTMSQLRAEGNLEEKKPSDNYLTWREWVEANIKIREINNEMEQLDSLEKFVENKERMLLRKIIAYSTPEIADRLFDEEEREKKHSFGMNPYPDESRSYVETFTRLVLNCALRLVGFSLPIRPRNSMIISEQFNREIDINSNEDLFSYSSSDEEETLSIDDNLEQLLICPTAAERAPRQKEKPSLKQKPKSSNNSENENTDRLPIITHTIMPSDEEVLNAQRKKIYRKDRFIDTHNEGYGFYSHLNDITIGSDLPDGENQRAVNIVAEELKEVKYSLYGIEMTKGSWIHFKNYINEMIFDKTGNPNHNINEDDDDKWLKLLYKPQTKQTEETETNENQQKAFNSIPKTTAASVDTKAKSIKSGTRRNMQPFEAQVKLLKLLYGVAGYAETLLMDNYPAIYSSHGYNILYSTNTDEKRKREALENMLRDIEKMILEARSQEDQQWLSNLIKYFRENYKEIYSIVLSEMPSLTVEPKHWESLRELVSDISEYLERVKPLHERIVPEAPSTPISQINQAHTLLENDYHAYKFPNYLRSWEKIFSRRSNYEDSGLLQDFQLVRSLIPTNEESPALSITSKEIEKITKVDTNWNKSQEGPFGTLLPFAKVSPFPNNQLTLAVNSQENTSQHIDWEKATLLDFTNSGLTKTRRDKKVIGDLYDIIILQSHLATKRAIVAGKDLVSRLYARDPLPTNILPSGYYDIIADFRRKIISSGLISRLSDRLSISSLISHLDIPKNVTADLLHLESISPTAAQVMTSPSARYQLMQRIYNKLSKFASVRDISLPLIPASSAESNIELHGNNDAIIQSSSISNTNEINLISTHLLPEDSYQIDEEEWSTAALSAFALGVNPSSVVSRFRSSSREKAISFFSNLGLPLPPINSDLMINFADIEFGKQDNIIADKKAELLHDNTSLSSELIQDLKANLANEELKLQEITMKFILSHNLYSRLRVKQQKEWAQMDNDERQLREKYNYRKHQELFNIKPIRKNEDIRTGQSTEQGEKTIENPAILFKFPSDDELQLLFMELIDDELSELVQQQVQIQKEQQQRRLEILEKWWKQNEMKKAKGARERDSVRAAKLPDNMAAVDPIYSYLKIRVIDYMTKAQRVLLAKTYENEYSTQLKLWNDDMNTKIQLAIAPRILKNINFKPDGNKSFEASNLLGKLAIAPNMTTEEWMTYLKDYYSSIESKPDAPNVLSRLNEGLFPEVSWNGRDHSILQMIYLREQLKRSHLPRYTISGAEFKDEEQFLTRTFWRGVWMYPEGLSNFLQIREPPKPTVRVLAPPPPPPPKQEKPRPPPPPPRAPVIMPVVQPAPPAQPVRPITPPIVITPPPIQPPILPPIHRPPPPPLPPPAPVQLPPPPPSIPSRARVQLPGTTYRQDVYRDLQRRLFGQGTSS